MQAWGLTDHGNVRKQNQDYYEIVELSEKHLLLVVCDGMGGAKSGNVASQLATDVFVSEIKGGFRPSLDKKKMEKLMKDALERSNTAVNDHSKISPDFEGMGTTLVAAILTNTGAMILNVGDSRGYVLGSDGVEMMTVDHSLVEIMVQRGDITREEAKNHPSKNLITRAVGTEPKVQCDIYHYPLKKGDVMLMCSDGLSNVLADQEILFEAILGVNKENYCERLLKIAKQRGAPDNVTVVMAVVS